MKKRFYDWINNTPIKKKFLPLQLFILLMVIFGTFFSFISVVVINESNQDIIDDNVQNEKLIYEIIQHMYVCRVMGRDMLLTEDRREQIALYREYTDAFTRLDTQMNDLSLRLEQDALATFNEIIAIKDAYKTGMMVSADIRIQGGNFEVALTALNKVNDTADVFFASINEFLLYEDLRLQKDLNNNEELVNMVLLGSFFVNALIIVTIVVFVRIFSSSMSQSLITLEETVSEIARTGNMRIDIPKHLYTEDEVGRIAFIVDELKLQLMNYSFKDALTGGYNAKAYKEELNEIFENSDLQKNFTCVICDINNLKKINDVVGHIEGDWAIKSSHRIIDENLSRYGKTFRIGGDEFVSILFNCEASALEKLFDNIRLTASVENEGKEQKFSLAFGVGNFEGKSRAEYDEFFQEVDKRMYENKKVVKAGRLDARVIVK